MPSEQKVALLERRKLEYAAKRQTTLENSTATTSKESSSSLEPCNIILPQYTLYMRDKPLTSRNVCGASHYCQHHLQSLQWIGLLCMLQLLRLDHIHQMLFNKSFNTQLKKSSWVSANVTRTSLTIVSFTEKEHVLPLTFDQRIAKKAKPLATSEQEMEPTIVESESLGTALALESLTQLRG
ncbi:hypothetical protein BC332_02899 [Capsicum chinense]|nr:hypothetical protein BC332_02899 [Capsicum chinense]